MLYNALDKNNDSIVGNKWVLGVFELNDEFIEMALDISRILLTTKHFSSKN